MGNEKGSREVTRNVLDFPKQTKLNEWVRSFYAELGMDDAESAKGASVDLKFPVSAGNIKYFRDLNKIPNNRTRRVVSDDYAGLETRVATLEEELLKQRDNVRILNEQYSILRSQIEVFKLAAKHNK